ncbi:uncharacterized protein LOC117322612 [Pecten maximus]|uniref:uncharacterized protein LOC117322612 n=1 Tax=Pecten maximus TaxID=6579 RepID=UPI0014580EB8|nr:uncharacterized protein LOC117322612 [Pecten maximus]
MAAKVSAVGLLILLLPCSLSEDRLIYIGKVVDALEKLVNYYKLNYEDLNVDGLFGLRVVEGQLNLLLRQYEEQGRHHNLSTDIISRLKDMKSVSSLASNNAVEYVRRDDEEYFQKLRFVVGKPWEFLKKHKELKNQLRWQPALYLQRRKTKLNEDVSDRCMAELMGTNSNSKRTCEISNFCIQMMTTTGLSGYGITHQLLWTVLAEKHGCGRTLNKLLMEKGLRSLEDYREEFCANNFYEMTDFINLHLHGIITPKYQDLFLEQQFVCPSLGYYQFLSYSYLDQMLSWQKPPGCYGVMHRLKTTNSIRNNQSKEFTDLSAEYTYEDDLENYNLNELEEKRNINSSDEHDAKGNNQNAVKSLDSRNLPSALKHVNIERQRSSDDKSIVPKAPVKENSDVVIQSGNGLVGKFTPVLMKVNSDVVMDTGKHSAGANVIQMNSQKVDSVISNNIQSGHQRSRTNVDTGTGNNQNSALNQISSKQNKQVIPGAAVERNGNEIEQQRQFRNQGQAGEAIHNIGRRLLAEKAMKEGCLAHKTAVAAGALVMYLRYLIDPGPMDIQRKIMDPSQHRFLMSREVSKQQSALNASHLAVDDGQDRDNDGLTEDEHLVKLLKAGAGVAGHLMEGNAPKLGVGEDYEENEAQNNLNAQLNLNNEEGDGNYYAHNGNEEVYDEKNKENLPDQSKDKKHMLVQFDNGPLVNADNKGLQDGYEEDGYKDDNHNNENEDGDYDEEKALNNFKNDVNHIQIGRKPVIPKADETDYTYYDEKEQHNGYNNFDEDESDTAETQKKILQPAQVLEDKVESIKKKTLTVDTLPHNSANPPNTLFLIVCASMLLVVFFMYRFIRSRRVHIRYHPRPFVRL